MELIIPTRGRVGKQVTFNSLPPKWQDKVVFVVSPEEKDAFERYGRPILVCEKVGVPAARQLAVDTYPQSCLFFLDDDLRFSQRCKGWEFGVKTKLDKMTFEDMGHALDVMEEELQEFAAVGFDARGGNNNRPYLKKRIVYRMMRAFGVDCGVLNEERIRFDVFPYWEDFHVTLELLKKGYANSVSMDFCADGVTNTAGGCSLYRNLDDLRTTRDAFIAMHSPFAVSNEKPAESWGGGMGGAGATVPDMRIFWRKAYAAGLASMGLHGGNNVEPDSAVDEETE